MMRAVLAAILLWVASFAVANAAPSPSSIQPPAAHAIPGDASGLVQKSRYWRCRSRRGWYVTHMTFPRGRNPVCHYRRRGGYSRGGMRTSWHGRGWRSTHNAWRHCRRRYGSSVYRALESRTKYRCYYRN